jgi:cytochrome c oxidase subunit III
MSHPDPQHSQRQAKVASMGMWLLIAALGMLFAATLVLYLVLRLTAEQWPPPGHPSLPMGWLSLSTFILIGSGFTIQFALHSVRQGRLALHKTGLSLTLVLALAYLVSQFMAWRVLWEANASVHGDWYAGTFYLLTVLHALHVFGGIIPLLSITAQAFKQRFSASYWLPVKSVVMYWHFLDAVWIVVFLVLLAGG